MPHLTLTLILAVVLGLVVYCLLMWLGVFLLIARAHRRHQRRYGQDYYGGSGELGLLLLAPLLPLLVLARLFDR